MFIVEFHDKRTLARHKSVARRRVKEYSTYHSRINSNVGSHGFYQAELPGFFCGE
jgi:hypothetical protein